MNAVDCRVKREAEQIRDHLGDYFMAPGALDVYFQLSNCGGSGKLRFLNIQRKNMEFFLPLNI